MWGRALRSYKGGFGTGRIDDEPERDGRLFGVIPMERPQLKVIWETLGLSTTVPTSAWHQIDEFEEFLFTLDAFKLSRFLFLTFWACRISFYFKRGTETVEVKNVRWFGADTIPDLYLTVDRLLLKFEAPPPMPDFVRL